MDSGPLVLIATAPRSGSSMVAGILHGHGAWAGKCREPDKWNPKGYFENIEINRIMVREFGTCVHECRKAEFVPVKDQILKEIRAQGYKGGPWLYKFSALYADAWREFDPVWVTVRRNRGAVEKSGQISGKNRNLDSIDLHFEVMDELEAAGAYRIYTPDVIRGDFSGFEKVLEAAGLKFDPKIAESFIEKEYWHYKG